MRKIKDFVYYVKDLNLKEVIIVQGTDRLSLDATHAF